MGLVYCLDRAPVGERWREVDARTTFKGKGKLEIRPSPKLFSFFPFHRFQMTFAPLTSVRQKVRSET